MFEKIKGIKIKSGIFEEETCLELFDGKFDGTNRTQNDRVSLLFGRNGSGKSTIARGIYQLKADEVGIDDKVALIDAQDSDIILEEASKKSIFVFNEDYIEQKVKIAQDGLDTIVILGEQVDIDCKIDIKKEELSEAQIKLQKYELELAEYNDAKNEKSPDYWMDKINASLKGLGHWAERDREIKGNRSASPVHRNTYQDFVRLQPVSTKEELETVFKTKKDRYLSLENSEISSLKKLILPDINFNNDDLANLLSKKIENPELNSRDKKLLSLLSDVSKGEPHLRQVEKFFSNKHNKTCPFCTQLVSEEVRTELISGITKLLSKEVEEHQEKLTKSKFLLIEELDMSAYEQLNLNLIKSYQDSIKTINCKLEEINIAIKKINSSYENWLPNGLYSSYSSGAGHTIISKILMDSLDS